MTLCTFSQDIKVRILTSNATVDPKRFKLRHENSSTGTESGSGADASVSSHQGSIASPSSMSMSSESNPRPSRPGIASASPGQDTKPYIKHSPSALPSVSRPDARSSGLGPGARDATDTAQISSRRRSSSYTFSRDTASPAQSSGVPPARHTKDPALSMRALPPPVPSRGAPYGLSSNAMQAPRKQDPMDALIAAAESQAPRIPTSNETQHG